MPVLENELDYLARKIHPVAIETKISASCVDYGDLLSTRNHLSAFCMKGFNNRTHQWCTLFVWL